jgi:hypothetical protein
VSTGSRLSLGVFSRSGNSELYRFFRPNEKFDLACPHAGARIAVALYERLARLKDGLRPGGLPAE